MKVRKVVPLLKKGKKILGEDYRPISNIPVFPSILENLMYASVTSYLLSTCQISSATGLPGREI